MKNRSPYQISEKDTLRSRNPPFDAETSHTVPGLPKNERKSLFEGKKSCNKKKMVRQ